MPSLPWDATHVEIAGGGEAVVFLHCLGGDFDFWREPVERLADRYRMVRYDFPGHGRTPVPSSGYTIHDLGDHCVALLESRAISRAHFVGVSLGGLVAMDVAARWPSRVASLVLADTTPKYSPRMAAGLTGRASLALSGGMAAVVDETLKIWFTPQAIEADAAAVAYARRVLVRTPAEGYALAVRALCEADLVAALPRIRCPTLVVCGSDDAAFVEPSLELSRSIQKAQLRWLSPARHAAVLELGKTFSAELQMFLESTSYSY